jgi:hypothetical protein
MVFCARATRGLRRPSPGLLARLGKSIAKQSDGRVGETYLPVGGQVRKLRAVGGVCPSRYLLSQAVNLFGFTACISFDTHRSDHEMSSASESVRRTMYDAETTEIHNAIR